MCGIAGIILDPERSLIDLETRLQAMSSAMAHRGPNDAGCYLSPARNAGLANRRLAIRDLSPAGHMPMSNQAGSVWITYNGEIYNTAELRQELEHAGYIFHSHSDTEVILHGYEAWGGSGVVARLRGMFAFAILTLAPHSQTVQSLFLARDRLGVKPLYFAQAAGGLLFASEIKALQASGLLSREISPAGLVGYLSFGAVPTPWTIYQDAKALPPASTLTWQNGAHQIRSYWQLPMEDAAGGTSPSPSYAAVLEQTRALLAEAVRIRLVSDVPLGAFLSGGLDSSAVVALMRQATTGPIRTCAMVFDETKYSEAPYARAMAQAVGAEHYERLITASDLEQELDPILYAMDQPTVDGVNTYFVSQTARQAGLTVALSGLGGDELFGGYPNTFQGAPQLWRALTLVQAIPGGGPLARAALSFLPDHRRWAKVAGALTRPASPATAYLARRGLFAPAEVQALVTPDLWQAAARVFDPLCHVTSLAGGAAPGGFAWPPRSDRTRAFSWISRAELRTYTQHQLLRDTDVMSMAHSLEVRVPLLDHRLVEMVLRLPAAFKLAGAGPKPLLVHALGDLLPPLIRQRRDKQGFTLPFDLWLKGRLRDRMTSILRQVQSRGWLQPQTMDQVARAHYAGQLHWSRLWALAALGAVA
ncbi:MAG: asparagine synthase (glutamine-hydrolyzing) [Chloroflexi bacterium]|nr:asparagine synthase (glutamine-hydrolyzing) [Chloroflexota bacterium]